MLVEKMGFDGVYVSGSLLSNSFLSDIGLTTQTEVATKGHQIARVTILLTIIDRNTIFGESLNVARTVKIFEESGIAIFHLED